MNRCVFVVASFVLTTLACGSAVDPNDRGAEEGTEQTRFESKTDGERPIVVSPRDSNSKPSPTPWSFS